MFNILKKSREDYKNINLSDKSKKEVAKVFDIVEKSSPLDFCFYVVNRISEAKERGDAKDYSDLESVMSILINKLDKPIVIEDIKKGGKK